MPYGDRGDTLRDLDKLVITVVGEQAKTECGNLQLCVDLEAGIEGENQAVGKQRLERLR